MNYNNQVDYFSFHNSYYIRLEYVDVDVGVGVGVNCTLSI